MENNKPKYNFDFKEIIERIPAAEAVARKVKETRHKSVNDRPLIDKNIDITKFGFLSGTIITIMMDRDIKYRDWMNYCLNTGLLSHLDIVAKKVFATNAISGLRNGQSFMEDRLEIYLDFLQLDIVVKDRITGKEAR